MRMAPQVIAQSFTQLPLLCPRDDVTTYCCARPILRLLCLLFGWLAVRSVPHAAIPGHMISSQKCSSLLRFARIIGHATDPSVQSMRSTGSAAGTPEYRALSIVLNDGK